MLTRAIRQLARETLTPSFTFAKASKHPKKEAPPPQPQSPKEAPAAQPLQESQPAKAEETPKQEQILKEEPAKPQEQFVRRRKDAEQEEDIQDEPLHKENRNTLGWWIYRFFFWGSAAVLTYDTYLVYNHKKKTPVQDQPGAIPFFIGPAKWLVNNFNDMVEFVTQPPSKKLLYDPVHPDLHPKTLILNLTGTILQSEYIFGKGIKTTVRPGLENMLKRLSQKYQIVIFAEEDEMTIMNKIMKIDPRQMHIRGVLGRESMVWKGGQFVKDLRYLNRDLKKVIAIDRRLENVKNQPENTIILSEFTGSEEDNQLTKLTFLLEKLVDVPDVRKYLATLGETPVETYYNRIKQAQDKMNKKANMFGFLGNPKSQKDKKDS